MRTACKHFNGFGVPVDKICSLGINIAERAQGRKAAFSNCPCVKGNRNPTFRCEKKEYPEPTPEEKAEKEAFIKKMGQAIDMFRLIIQTKANSGTIPCACGKNARFLNHGHISIVCEHCGMTAME